MAARLLAWFLPVVALALAIPAVPLPVVGAPPVAPNSTQQPPPEEDHHSSPTNVAMHADAHRKARKFRLRGVAHEPQFVLPLLRDRLPKPDLRALEIEGAAFALKLHRAQLPRRTGPSDGDPELS